MSGINCAPASSNLTHRAWKSRKRQEWRAVIRALETFRLGCAFTPVRSETLNIIEQAESLTERLSIREWGR
jgi:hypothetical protein